MKENININKYHDKVSVFHCRDKKSFPLLYLFSIWTWHQECVEHESLPRVNIPDARFRLKRTWHQECVECESLPRVNKKNRRPKIAAEQHEREKLPVCRYKSLFVWDKAPCTIHYPKFNLDVSCSKSIKSTICLKAQHDRFRFTMHSLK